MKLIAGSAHPELAGRIAEHLAHPLTDVTLSSFPDGEFFCKIEENIRGEDVFLIQPTCPPANQNIMELLILLDACRRASARRVNAVIPYYGYARQDRKDQPRVPITAKLVADLLQTAGSARVLGLDFHSEQIQGFFNTPVDHLYAYPVVVEHLKAREWEGLTIVSPDSGGFKRAYRYAEMLSAGLAVASKNRKSAEEVESVNLVGDVEGRDALLVDDMTTTAGTLTSAAELLTKRGAKSVTAYVTHCLLNEKGYDRLRNSSIVELITTDSIPGDDPPDLNITRLGIASLLGDAISRIHNNQSVTSLFRVK